VRDLGVHFAQGYLLARPAAVPPAPTWPLGADALGRSGAGPPRPETARVGASPPVAPNGRTGTRPEPPLRRPPPPKPVKRRSGRPGQ
jgi:hypothetical protein